MAEQMSPELRELKRQTRMMAEKEANRAAGGGALIGIVIVLVLLFNAVVLPTWAMFGLPLVLGFVAYRGAYNRYTRG